MMKDILASRTLEAYFAASVQTMRDDSSRRLLRNLRPYPRNCRQLCP
jgi:hypothetical protein